MPPLKIFFASAPDKGTSNDSVNKSQTLPQLCNHFNKGTCKFGDPCKFIHDHHNPSGLASNKNLGTTNAIGRMISNTNPMQPKPYHAMLQVLNLHLPGSNDQATSCI